jgi:autotransporter-associated beta strand protein
VSAGTLTVTKLANSGALSANNSSIGRGSTTPAVTLANGTTLKFTGSGTDSTNRSLTLPGTGTVTLDASGAGTITYTALTSFAGTTIALAGSSTGSNTLSASLSGGGNVSKSGAGKWVLTNSTHSGTTTVSAGTLDFNAQTVSIGNISVSGGVLANGTLTPTATVGLTGGQVTAGLAGTSKTITASSGTPEIAPTSGANSISGTTTVSGGTLRLTTELDVSIPATGRVLGTTNATVQNGAAIRTSTGTAQKGRMRYGGNLTFNAGSSLYIGG